MPRILLIDDTKSIRTAVLAALDPFGFEVEQAESGPAGLQKALNAQWDLIFLDIEMPIMDGPTLLRIVRARGITTPVVLVTGVSSTPVLSAAIRLGAAHYISKPFTGAQIRAAAAKLLKIDHSKLDAPPPRVFVLAPDRALADELTPRLPANVIVSTVAELHQLTDLITQHVPGLVLIAHRPGQERANIAAAVVRSFAPTAGVLLVDEQAKSETLAPPDSEIDGTVPRALSDALVQELFYPNYLRQLVFVTGTTVRPATFQGEPQFMPAYFASLTRHLIARCARFGAVEGLRIDLTPVPPVEELLVPLIAAVSAALNAQGAAAWFSPPPTLKALANDPRLTKALFV